ncbi:MAG TPA: GNAT family N-acetyltransferase, partial [Acidimicrobiales bacterium]|nr:GNAT family N-acetyltransferase [Acidimicrobiales bacterium]
IAVADGADIGWIQCYLAVDNPDATEDWWDFDIRETAAGIDCFVAEPARRGRGTGSTMIRAFAREIVLGCHADWSQVCAGPFAANTASCRALANAGFRHLGTVDDDDGPCQLYALDR